MLEQEVKSAIGQYEHALKIASAIEDRYAEINILGGLFRAHALDGDIRLAMLYGEQVIHLARQYKHVEAEFSNITAYASFLVENGKTVDAIAHLQRGLGIAEDQNNLGLQVDMLTRLGLAHYQDEQNELAIEHFNKALGIARSVKDDASQAQVLGYLASEHADMAQYDRSIEAASKALSLAESLEDHRLGAEQQILLALNYRDLSHGELAIQYCSSALEAFRKIDDQPMVERAQMLLDELKATEK